MSTTTENFQAEKSYEPELDSADTKSAYERYCDCAVKQLYAAFCHVLYGDEIKLGREDEEPGIYERVFQISCVE